MAEKEENLRAQAALLQERLGLHGGRLWQLPLTYVGVLALVAGIDGSGESGYQAQALKGIAIAGLVLLVGHIGAIEGYSRAAQHLSRVEGEMGLTVSTKASILHWLPYLMLLVAATGFAFALGW